MSWKEDLKIATMGYFYVFVLRDSGKKQRNVRRVETGIHLSQGSNANDDVQSLNI